jgi:hypothetical protein
MAEAAERRSKNALPTTAKASPTSTNKALTPPTKETVTPSPPIPALTQLPSETPLVPELANVPTPSGREALAEAAERRAKSAQARGTNASNPKRGQLATKASKPLSKTPTPSNEPERLIVCQ